MRRALPALSLLLAGCLDLDSLSSAFVDGAASDRATPAPDQSLIDQSLIDQSLIDQSSLDQSLIDQSSPDQAGGDLGCGNCTTNPEGTACVAGHCGCNSPADCTQMAPYCGAKGFCSNCLGTAQCAPFAPVCTSSGCTACCTNIDCAASGWGSVCTAGVCVCGIDGDCKQPRAPNCNVTPTGRTCTCGAMGGACPVGQTCTAGKCA
jgi:hypothetical protein